MTIDPAVLIGLLTSAATAFTGAITVLFRALMKANEDMRTDRDHWRTTANTATTALDRLTADHSRLVGMVERGYFDAPKDVDTHPARRRSSA